MLELIFVTVVAVFLAVIGACIYVATKIGLTIAWMMAIYISIILGAFLHMFISTD